MNKISLLWRGLILLLVLAIGGWLLYQRQHNPAVDTMRPVPVTDAREPMHIRALVLQYGSNPDGDVDRMLISSNEEKVWVNFPPHTAIAVTAIAKLGSHIEATIGQEGPPHHHPGPMHALKTVQNEHSKQVIDLTQIPAPAPRKGSETEITGSVLKDYKRGSELKNGFILSGRQVSLPPHMAHELFPLIDHSKFIFVKGAMRDSTEGFLSASRLPVIKASLIQLDSVIYKIR